MGQKTEQQAASLPFSRRPLTSRRARYYEIWDILAIIVAVISLLLILFCWIYRHTPLSAGLTDLSPVIAHYAQYLSTHENSIDLGFVTFFVIDILAGWTCAIIDKRYYRWFFYPFVHWYDVLGSLPFSGFRWLRILRVVGLGIRLQNSGTIDVRKWKSYAFFHKYYDILMEELSDRVATKLITNAQEDIKEDNGLVEKIIDKAIKPQRDQLIDMISAQLLDVSETLGNKHTLKLEHYLTNTTRQVLQRNNGIRALNQLPFGRSVTSTLESSLNDVVVQMVRETRKGVKSEVFEGTVRQLVADAFDKALKHPSMKGNQLDTLLIESLEVIKEEVGIKRWKTRYSDSPDH